MGVYGLVWTQLGHRGTVVLFWYLTVLFRYLRSIHNTYNVPSEPERAAKARRAVVASVKKTSIFFEENLKLFKMLSKLLKLLMNFKKVQNQTSNQATINQKVNGNLKRKRRKHSNL